MVCLNKRAKYARSHSCRTQGELQEILENVLAIVFCYSFECRVEPLPDDLSVHRHADTPMRLPEGSGMMRMRGGQHANRRGEKIGPKGRCRIYFKLNRGTFFLQASHTQQGAPPHIGRCSLGTLGVGQHTQVGETLCVFKCLD
jgi:hypothetical protein